jgi:6-phosphogluconolactonase
MSKINSAFSQGDHPCHVTIDSKNRYVIVSNYTGGNFKAIPLLKDGSLDTINTQVIQHTGKSINKVRQEKPHVHSAIFSPDEDYLLIQDLGTDQISVYDISLSKSNNPISLKPNSVFNTVPGSGPRHLTFHPKKSIAYSVQELNGTVNVLKFKNGKLSLMQDISMTNPNETRKNGAADIHISPDGKYLYASNRGEFNEVVIFRIIADGTLSYVATQSTLGKGPRNFSIDPTGNFLLVANQNSDEIVVFKRDQNSGLLTDTKERIKVGAPVCIQFIAN